MLNELSLGNSKKVYWLNGNSIRTSDVAELDALREIHPDGYSSTFWHNCITIDDFKQFKILIGNIIQSKKISTYTIDISEITGLSASKSPLEECASMTAFVEQYCRPYFDISEDELDRNLRHDEIRIISRDDPSDRFVIFGWKDGLYLSNSGGSHHLASAQYIAHHLKKPVSLKARLNIDFIDYDALLTFDQYYLSYLVSRSTFYDLFDAFENSDIKIIGYRSGSFPLDTFLIVLPKNIASNKLKEIFHRRLTSFNIELFKFYEIQRQNSTFNKAMGLINET